MNIYGVIMAGGGGTRFWPLSRHRMPKQLLNLSGKDTMIGETVSRIATVTEENKIYIVTNKDQVPGMEDAVGSRIGSENILSEPAARNTAACVGYAAVTIRKKYGDGIMCISPADHFIKDVNAFTKTLKSACDLAAEKDVLITLGITPTFPSTGYGYIRFDKNESADAKKVIEFKEKPDEPTAKEYVASGEYAWNSGMFVWKASTVLKEFEKYLPGIYAELIKIEEAIGTPDEKKIIEEIYPTIESISIDYGIMEKSDNVLVIPAEMGWNDVGSWDNLGVIYDEDTNGNIHNNDAFIDINSTGVITYSKNKKLIASVGLKDIMIVETDDAILVCDKTCAQDVKKVVDELKEKGKDELL